MWRRLIVIGQIIGLVVGLSGTTVASAEARSFRFSFRPRSFTASRPVVRPFERKMSTGVVIFHRDEAARPPVASILDTPGQVVHQPVVATASPDRKPAMIKPSGEQTTHWCDNGKIVGSGTGFCVLRVSTDEAS